jgi:5-methylcytosine-specific restriction endonuclease McrA
MTDRKAVKSRLLSSVVVDQFAGGYIQCSHCGEIFGATDNRVKYCSEKCRIAGHKKKTPPRKEAYCIICGSPFLKYNPDHKVCGNPDCKRENARHLAQKNLNKINQIREYFVFERDNFTCAYCGKSSFADGVQLHVDHIIPAIKGGESIAGNLITSCATCNVTKNDTDITCKEEILAVISARNLARGIDNNSPVRIWADPLRRIV